LFLLYSASVNALHIVFSDSLYESTAKWETSQIFRGQIVDAHLTGASVTKTATLLGVSRAAVSRVMTTYTNHGRTSTKGIVSINHKNTTAKVTAELHLEHCFHKNSLLRASKIQQHSW